MQQNNAFALHISPTLISCSHINQVHIELVQTAAIYPQQHFNPHALHFTTRSNHNDRLAMLIKMCY